MAPGISFESMSFFRLWGALWAMSKVRGSPRVLRLLGFILLVNFSGALYLWFRFWTYSMTAIWVRFCSPGGVVGGSCGGYGSLLAWGGLWAVSAFGGSACGPRLPGFVLLVGFSGALGMGCHCHLGWLLQSWGVINSSCGAWCVRTSPSEVYPAGKLQWHFTCGFDFRNSLWLPFKAAFPVLKVLILFPLRNVLQIMITILMLIFTMMFLRLTHKIW